MGGEVGNFVADLIKHPVLFVVGGLILVGFAYFYFYGWRFKNWQEALTKRFIKEGVLEVSDPNFASDARLGDDPVYVAYSEGLQHFVFWNKRQGKWVIPFSQIRGVRFFYDRAGEEEEVQWRDGEIYEQVGGQWEAKRSLSIPVIMFIAFQDGGGVEIAMHRLEDLKEWAARVEGEVRR